MNLNLSALGITADFDEEYVVIRIGREHVSALISILLHSKFSDGPRIEFLTNPYVNALLEALMATNKTTKLMAKREEMSQALAPIIALVEDWTKENEVQAAEAATLLQSAIYPYSLT